SQRSPDVGEHLLDLPAHVALADDLAVLVARQDAGQKHELAGHHGDDRRIKQVALDDPLRQSFRKYVLPLHHRAPSSTASPRPIPCMDSVQGAATIQASLAAVDAASRGISAMQVRSAMIAVLVAWGAFLAAATPAAAQSFPSKAVRIVVPYPAGGSVDIVTRA